MDTSTTHNGTISASNTDNKTAIKPKRQRYLPGLPSASTANEMNKATYSVLIDRTPTEFVSLENGETFSTTPDGSAVFMKTSRSKANRITDGKPFPTGGGRVYRASFMLTLDNKEPSQNQGNS
jgi:hypothetical protein